MNYFTQHRLSVAAGLAAILFMTALSLHSTGKIGDLGLSKDGWDYITLGAAVLAAAGYVLPNTLETPAKRDQALLRNAPRLGLTRKTTGLPPKGASDQTGSATLGVTERRAVVETPRRSSLPFDDLPPHG